jgi:hypothetical protein
MDAPQNTGSFAAAIGGVDQLKSLLQAKGVNLAGATQVQSAASPGAPPNPGQVSNIQSAQAALPQPTPATSETPSTDPELNIAIKALGEFVKTGGQTRRDLAKAKVQGII